MAERKKHAETEIIESSGNVFRDAGLPDAEERQTKVRIAVVLNMLLDRLGMTQRKMASRMGTDQPKVSALRRYKLDGLSVERLMEFLTALDCDVDIRIKPKAGRRGTRAGRIHVRLDAA